MDYVAGVVGDPVSTPFEAVAVSVSPDAKTAYASGHGQLAVVDLATGTASSIDLSGGAVGNNPYLNAISPDGSTLYLQASGQLIVPVNAATGAVGTPVPAPPGSLGRGIAITPDGKTAYVGDEQGSSVFVVDLASGVIVDAITTGVGRPVFPVITPDGSTVIVPHAFDFQVAVIDTATRAVKLLQAGGNYVSLLANPNEVLARGGNDFSILHVDSGVLTHLAHVENVLNYTLAADRRTVVVLTQLPDTLVTIDSSTGTMTPPIPLPALPYSAAAIRPDQAPVAKVTSAPATAGEATTLDASGSSAECGAILSYEWDFGDGTPLETTTVAHAAHPYTHPGSYTATMTATDTAGTSSSVIYGGQFVSNNGGPSAVAATTVEVVAPSGLPDLIAATPTFTG